MHDYPRSLSPIHECLSNDYKGILSRQRISSLLMLSLHPSVDKAFVLFVFLLFLLFSLALSLLNDCPSFLLM